MLSLDTSTNSTGWALFIDGKYVESGCIKIDNDNNKMAAMIWRLFYLLDIKRPNIVVVEEMAVTRNAKVARNLTMVLGAVFGKCLEMKTDYYSLRPTEWRKLIDSGKKPSKREELKKWSKQKVLELFDIDNVNDDVSDAILIGQAYINMFNWG